MKKKVNIGGNKIDMKASAKNLLIYRDYFGEDMLRPQWDFIDNAKAGAIEKMNGLDIIKIAWTLAKTADDSIPNLDEWLDGFNDFPIVEAVNELTELILSNLTSITPIKNEKATEKGEKRS